MEISKYSTTTTIPEEAHSKTDDNLFKPANFYNLHGAGFGIWIVCIVLGNIWPDMTSTWFKIIALGLALLVSLLILLDSEHKHKLKYQLLVIFNASLIFVNASGINSITYSFNNDKLSYKPAEDSSFYKPTNSYLGMLDIINQKNWWPDDKMIYEKDSIGFSLIVSKRKNEVLTNQILFIKDWLQDKIKDKNFRKEFDALTPLLGKYEPDSTDLALLKYDHSTQIRELNTQIDLLTYELKLEKASTWSSTVTIDGITKTTNEWVDSLYSANYYLANENSKLISQAKKSDSLYRVIQQLIKK